MDLNKYFKSIIDQDNASVVVCNTEHEVIYMNPAAAANYAKRGGIDIVGRLIFDCHNEQSAELIKKVVDWFKASRCNNKVHTFYEEKQQKDGYMIALRDEYGELIGYYEKHEFRARDMSDFYAI